VTGPELIDLATGERFAVEESITVGRTGCDIVFADELVSRQHAAIRVTQGGLEIEDLGSRNGTSVNGELIAAARALQPGDTVAFGQVRLRVDMPGPAAVAGWRGDVPPPEPEPLEGPVAAAATAPVPAAPATFGGPGAESRRRSASAARRGVATAIALAIIAATAAALILYFVDRGL
jgi:predicted component of type VI protein secretion system